MVFKALQRANYIPAGMELFKAANAQAWNQIEATIALSDYYILIVAGRYGSLTESGISYTEAEYNLAVRNNLPVLAFLHADPTSIVDRFTEARPHSRDALVRFRETLANSHHLSRYSNSSELALEVILALQAQQEQWPRPGWIRGTIDNASAAPDSPEPTTDRQEDKAT